jgi:hypothetical protein
MLGIARSMVYWRGQNWGMGKNIMRKLLATAAVLALATSAATAGGMAEPTMQPDVIEAATSSASHDIIVPLMLLLVIVAVLSAPDGPAT